MLQWISRKGDYSASQPSKVSSSSELSKDDVRALYQEEEAKTSLTSQLEWYLATSYLGLVVDVVSCSAALVGFLVYVIGTYQNMLAEFYAREPDNPLSTDPNIITGNLRTTELVILGVFIVDYLIRLMGSKSKLAFILTPMAVVDLLTIAPLGFVLSGTVNVVEPFEDSNAVLVYRILRVLQIVRVFRVYRILAYAESEIQQQLFSMILTVLTILLVATGLLHITENLRYLWLTQDNPYPNGLHFHDSLYLIVTTITTVGYGDISPKTMPGRFLIIIMMLTALVLVPQQTNQLITLMSMTTIYGRAHYRPHPNTTHVIVCGAVNSAGVIEFFTELFHEDHHSVGRRAVVIGQGLPSSEMQSLLGDPRFSFSLTYLDGNVMNERDLRRAAATSAHTVFVLCNKFALNADEEDAGTILRALSVKRFVQQESFREIQACIQLIVPESKKLFLSTADGMTRRNQIVCIDEIKMNILAKSCLCPGTCTMICNLISSSSYEPSKDEPEWVKEYCDGCGYEIYRVPLSEVFEGMSFLDAAQIIYDEAGSLIFALELHPPNMSPRVVLNPGIFKIPSVRQNRIHAFVMADDQKEAGIVSTIGKLAEIQKQKSVMKKISRRMSSGNEAFKMINRVEKRFITAKTRSSPVDDDEVEVKSDIMLTQEETETSLWKRKAAKAIFRNTMITNNFEEIDESTLQNLYFYSYDPMPLKSATIRSVEEDIPSCKDHIIIIGSTVNLAHFVLPLRSKHLKEVTPIIILNPTPPSEQSWSRLANFTQVWYVEGSSLEINDLKRAGIQKASRVVIFAKEYDKTSKTLEALADADTIFAYRVIARENKNVQMVAELVTPSNLTFLTQNVGTNNASESFLAPPFAAGHVYTASMLDTLVCQAFYNPHIITILSHIVGGCDPLLARQFDKQMKGKLGILKDSHLYQIPIPKKFVLKTYGDLFQHLVSSSRSLPIGLRRGITEKIGVGQNENTMSYVYTNPDKDSLLYKEDHVFILAQSPPKTQHRIKSKTAGKTTVISTAKLLKTGQQRAHDKFSHVMDDFSAQVFSKLDTIMNEVVSMQDRIAKLEKLSGEKKMD